MNIIITLLHEKALMHHRNADEYLAQPVKTEFDTHMERYIRGIAIEHLFAIDVLRIISGEWSNTQATLTTADARK